MYIIDSKVLLKSKCWIDNNIYQNKSNYVRGQSKNNYKVENQLVDDIDVYY